MENHTRKVSPLLALGILFMPHIFSWFTLRKGYSTNARIVSFLWIMGFFSLGLITTVSKLDPNMAAKMRETSPVSTPTPEQLKTVEASELALTYSNNEVFADDYYDGKTFIIKGKITSISKTITGKPYVMLKGHENSYTEIQVLFERSEKDNVADFYKGQIISAKATCRGKTLGNVIMDDAEVR